MSDINNKNVHVDTSSILTTKNKMIDGCNDLIELLDIYAEMFKETESIYNTESATLYRKLADKYIDYVKKYVNNSLKVYIDDLDNIRKMYIDEINSINVAIKGDNE